MYHLQVVLICIIIRAILMGVKVHFTGALKTFLWRNRNENTSAVIKWAGALCDASFSGILETLVVPWLKFSVSWKFVFSEFSKSIFTLSKIICQFKIYFLWLKKNRFYQLCVYQSKYLRQSKVHFTVFVQLKVYFLRVEGR